MEEIEEFLNSEEEIKKIREYIELIKKEKNLTEKEILELFKELKKELDSIISDNITIFEILLNRLGIKKEEFKSVEKKIAEVKEGEYVIVQGKVVNVRASEKFASLKIYDDTGSIRVVTFEPKRFKDIYEGSTIKIIDGFVRETDFGKEIVVGKRTKIEIIEKPGFPVKKIKEINENEFVESKALVIKVYDTKIVERKIEKDGQEITIEKPLTPLLLTDETGSIFAYYEGRTKDVLGKTVLVRGKSFKSQKGDIRLNLRTLIELDTEEELLNL